MSDKIREGFETWASTHTCLGGCEISTLDGFYRDIDLQCAWESWQASRESAYTAIDMTTAAAEGFRDGVASVVVDLEPDEPADEGAAYLHQDFVKARIIAAGGGVKP